MERLERHEWRGQERDAGNVGRLGMRVGLGQSFQHRGLFGVGGRRGECIDRRNVVVRRGQGQDLPPDRPFGPEWTPGRGKEGSLQILFILMCAACSMHPAPVTVLANSTL